MDGPFLTFLRKKWGLVGDEMYDFFFDVGTGKRCAGGHAGWVGGLCLDCFFLRLLALARRIWSITGVKGESGWFFLCWGLLMATLGVSSSVHLIVSSRDT